MIKKLFFIPIIVIVFLYMMHTGIMTLLTKSVNQATIFEFITAITFGVIGILIICGIIVTAMIVVCMFIYWFLFLSDEITWIDYIRSEYNL